MHRRNHRTEVPDPIPPAPVLVPDDLQADHSAPTFQLINAPLTVSAKPKSCSVPIISTKGIPANESVTRQSGVLLRQSHDGLPITFRKNSWRWHWYSLKPSRDGANDLPSAMAIPTVQNRSVFRQPDSRDKKVVRFFRQQTSTKQTIPPPELFLRAWGNKGAAQSIVGGPS